MYALFNIKNTIITCVIKLKKIMLSQSFDWASSLLPQTNLNISNSKSVRNMNLSKIFSVI